VSELAADLACALDPVRFARAAGYVPDEWQERLLRSSAPRILLNCARQSGKSLMTALLALHTALYVPGALVLLLSPGERQSGEIFRKLMDAYRTLGRPTPATRENQLELELATRSRIIALPGEEGRIRSYSGAALLVVDEAARIADALYKSVRPMLAVSGGRLILLSTPWGKRGVFHQEWTQGLGWERYEVPASMCPRISPAFLEEERRALGNWWYQQEYECQFSETSDQIFSHEVLAASLSAEVKPLFATGGASDYSDTRSMACT
jgi:hypothetical protein